jgi:excisionase family DNA binding protein
MSVSLDPPIMLTTAEAARHLGVSEASIRRYAREGHLPASRLYGRGRWRYELADVDALLVESPSRDREAA